MKNLYFLTIFFYHYPALFYSLFFMLGIAFFLYNKFVILFFFIFAVDKKKIIFSILLFTVGYFYSNYLFSDIKKIKNPIEGRSFYKIDNVKEIYNFNNKFYQYNGTINSIEVDKLIYRNINASISSKIFYSPDFSYIVDGTLVPNENFNFYIKSKKIWVKDSTHLSLTKIRYKCKKAFYNYLMKTIKDVDSVNFLHTLITGDSTHKFLSFSFAKIGLQHVLAISGFHFGVFTLFFSFFLRLFLPRTIVIYALLILVNAYFLFIGPLFSVQRSYIMIQMALLGQLLNRKYIALNAIGISLLIILMLDPLGFKNIGFQLSFLCTFAILLLHPIIESFSSKILIKRTPNQIKELSVFSKISLNLVEYLRQNICLCISVNIFILPVLLFYFHRFALISIIYNLFIPFLVGISLMLVMIGSICYFLPLIGFLINSTNAFFTKIVLNLITYPPATLEIYLRSKIISLEFVVIYLICLIFLVIFLRHFLKRDQTPEYCNFL
jgi:competence protein ComEC